MIRFLKLFSYIWVRRLFIGIHFLLSSISRFWVRSRAPEVSSDSPSKTGHLFRSMDGWQSHVIGVYHKHLREIKKRNPTCLRCSSFRWKMFDKGTMINSTRAYHRRKTRCRRRPTKFRHCVQYFKILTINSGGIYSTHSQYQEHNKSLTCYGSWLPYICV